MSAPCPPVCGGDTKEAPTATSGGPGPRPCMARPCSYWPGCYPFSLPRICSVPQSSSHLPLREAQKNIFHCVWVNRTGPVDVFQEGSFCSLKTKQTLKPLMTQSLHWRVGPCSCPLYDLSTLSSGCSHLPCSLCHVNKLSWDVYGSTKV